ncbi:hypothetical protein LTR82_015869 [Friedmanniomyces endolithicus]|uniref:PPPDE domain-containing protein n=1 Tax=Friedmanniomyces endolithicus TaxID=329885 RepID=A0AAN6F8S5_9PEZI|nr:hypothetical protein LTR82_015869 [Friedmanniomyces endolithicus]
MPSSTTRPKRSRASSPSTSHNTQPSTQAPARTEITINVYDLLPPGRLSSLLWTLGSSLLHSGLQIGDREYAFGGHSRPKTTGVYFTAPRFETPGVTFRCGIPQGTTQRSPAEIEKVVKEVGEAFLGEKYNLLTNNCNHFTSALCERLTGRRGPAWLNRAASVGLALPCMVPREWVQPPDCETAEGELVDEEGDEDEQAAMLDFDRRREVREAQKRERGRRSRQASEGSVRVRKGGGDGAEEVGSSVAGGRRIAGQSGTPPPRVVSVKDTSGREMPVAERAPLPKIRRERSDSAGW